MRGVYDVQGMRADADFMVWWHAESSDDLQDAYSALPTDRARRRRCEPVWSQMALHRPAEFNKSHVPAFLADEEPRRLRLRLPVRALATSGTCCPTRSAARCSSSTGRWGATTRMCAPTRWPSFALGDYEWMLAFEADELHRIVDLMRDLRASTARRHVREEIPFYTGRRRPVQEIVASLP